MKKKKSKQADKAKAGAAAMARLTHGRKTKFEDQKKKANKKACRKKDSLTDYQWYWDGN